MNTRDRAAPFRSTGHGQQLSPGVGRRVVYIALGRRSPVRAAIVVCWCDDETTEQVNLAVNHGNIRMVDFIGCRRHCAPAVGRNVVELYQVRR